jgi:hypothetical protein
MLVQPLPPVLSAPEPHSQFQKFHMVLLPSSTARIAVCRALLTLIDTVSKRLGMFPAAREHWAARVRTTFLFGNVES